MEPEPGPTITHHQEIAARFCAAFDEIIAIIPNVEAEHVMTRDFVRYHQNVSTEFLLSAIAAVDQTPDLEGLHKLDVAEGHDALQFIDAYRPVVDRVMAFANALQFTMRARRATLTAAALQIYALAKDLARDPASADAAVHVANMKRDLGPRGRRARRAPEQGGVTPPRAARIASFGNARRFFVRRRLRRARSVA